MAVALDPNDTIVAVASPPGPGLRGIVRLSGPAAIPVALENYRTDERGLSLPSRRAAMSFGSLRVDGLRPLLPVMVALWPAPRTYTGQDVVEIHLIGSAPIVQLVVAHCLARGARHAEPGEFTLRAFLSGRIDLTRAEAVMSVIEANNPAQLDAALVQLGGGLSGPIVALRDHLLDVVAHLEANLDFTEEPDVDPLARSTLAAELADSADALAGLARRLSDRESDAGARPRVVLVGPPNVGKSRLFNALLGHERAIVADLAGTTRDYLAARCECDGLFVELVDTAGIEAGHTAIMKEAQSQRVREIERADLLLVCHSAETGELASEPVLSRPGRLEVWTQSDRAVPGAGGRQDLDLIVTSAATGIGVDRLRVAIAQAIRGMDSDHSPVSDTGARCRGSLKTAEAALQRAAATLQSGSGDELVALDLRSAVDELGKVVGAVVTDDILDRIFSRFCIGK
jgi:tRNA modification GTPase